MFGKENIFTNKENNFLIKKKNFQRKKNIYIIKKTYLQSMKSKHANNIRPRIFTITCEQPNSRGLSLSLPANQQAGY